MLDPSSKTHVKLILPTPPSQLLFIFLPCLPPPAAFTDDSSVLRELCATLARLSVRNEFCQEIVDLGGLNFMVALLADCIDHQVLSLFSEWDAFLEAKVFMGGGWG